MNPTTSLPTFVALLATGCAGAPQPPTPPATPAGPAHATRIADRDGLPNLARITPALYRGGQPDADGYRQLRAMGVKTVISLRRFHDSRAAAESAGLDHVAIPIYAAIGSSAPTDEQVRAFFATVLDPARQPVYVHCKFGQDRTGMMAAVYRIECEGWSRSEAIDEMQAFGYHDIYDDLIDFVRDYEPRGFESAAGRD